MVTSKKYSTCQNDEKCIERISMDVKNFNSNTNNINNDNVKMLKNCKYNSWYFKKFTYAILIVLTTAIIDHQVLHVHTAAVFLNGEFRVHPRFEPLCSAQQEHFVESDGKRSSLILEFKPGNMEGRQKSCTRILSAPPTYGFIVRLILPKIRRGQYYHATALTAASSEEQNNTNAHDKLDKLSNITITSKSTTTTTTNATSALNDMTSMVGQLNATSLASTANGGRKCPMSIYSSLDPHSPQWRVDPCQLEDTAPEMEDPVRLFHGRVRIVWEHNNHHLHSKLMVTVLGKGEQCRHENKHQCLRIGDEPLLCIAKELECDGIRHCPVSNEYDSDEDYKMCWKHRRFSESLPPAMESEIFEHFAMEVFRNLFAFDVTQGPETASSGEVNVSQTFRTNNTGIHTVNTFENGTIDNSLEHNNETAADSSGLTGRRNSTRSGLQSDLAKYGPWGYLMLGMLLCGGALLICGLWASASQNAVNNEREAGLQQGNSGGNSSGGDPSSNMSPPNYDDLDPPPAYSVLFPNQKASSNATLNSLTTPISPSSVPSSSGTLVVDNQRPTGSQPRVNLNEVIVTESS